MMDLIEGQDIFLHNFIQDHEEIIRERFSEIQVFYESSVVFLTGVTGFLGQVLLEKLLRSTKVKKVYVLVRAKNGKTGENRLDEILSGLLFGVVANSREGFRSLIQIISGDCCLPCLGICSEDRSLLIREVNVVFHAAASPSHINLKQHILVNVSGTRVLIDLVKEMRNIQAFIYVSTAFAEISSSLIEERVTYDGKWDWEKLTTLVNVLDDVEFKLLEETLWTGYPNPQIFTKHVVELMIRELGCEFPVGIFRPSLLVSTAFEPLVGWLNDAEGVQKIVHLSLSGLLRVFIAQKFCKADLVPVDFAANGVLAFAWSIGNIWKDGPNLENVQATKMEPVVMNFTSGRVNQMTWGYFIHMCLFYGLAIPKLSDHSLPHVVLNDNILTLQFFHWIFHRIPAIFSDILRHLTGREMIWISFYNDLHQFLTSFQHFTTKQWSFQDKFKSELWKKLGNKDKILFNLNFASIDWNDFIQIYVRGLRIYYVKEEMSTLHAAKQKMARLKIWFYLRRIGSFLAVLYLILSFL